MKRAISILLTVLMLLSLAACGGSQPAPETPTPEDGLGLDPLILLSLVWDSYGDDEKFPVFGGNQDSADPVMDAPGAFDLGDTVGLDDLLGVPADAADKLDAAADLVHMLNTNTFTCGAFSVKNTEDMDALAAEIRENITHRQWICGFPDKLVVVTCGNCIISFFGAEELVDTFHAKLYEHLSNAETVYAEPLGIVYTVDPVLWRS